MLPNDDAYMLLALNQAKLAFQQGEVPVGAVAVSASGVILAQAYNQTLQNHDPCAHAEILVLREAAQKTKNHRLTDVTLYVTLEPCSMCAGAMIQARIRRVVFATRDWVAGAAGTVVNLLNQSGFNHRVAIDEGLYQEDSKKLLQHFFQMRR